MGGVQPREPLERVHSPGINRLDTKKPALPNRVDGFIGSVQLALPYDRLRNLEIHVAIAVDLLAKRNVDPR